MIVPEGVLKSVGFIAAMQADGKPRFFGSVFFVACPQEPSPDEGDIFFAVTARHVINELKSQTAATETYLRLNRWDAAVWASIPITDWFSHPMDSSIDVAVTKIQMPAKLDHRVVGRSLWATQELLDANEVGVGDEVFITGLFSRHYGESRNVPIVRVGNLACMEEERVRTTGFGLIEGYLIEARSLGGLSGSPVFVNLSAPRTLKSVVNLTGGRPPFMLLGLVHGHFDENKGGAGVNTGIAVVVPFDKIASVLTEHEKCQPNAVVKLELSKAFSPPDPDEAN